MRRESLRTWMVGLAAVLLAIANPTVAAEDPSLVAIPEVPVIAVTGEPMEIHVGGGTGLWQGNIPPSLRTYECGTTGNLCRDSLTVRSGGRMLREGTDYRMDWKYSKIAFLPESGLSDGAPVTLDYRYRQRRIDSLVRQADGATRLLIGTPALNEARPPERAVDSELLANYFTDYDGTVHCYPVRPPAPSGSTPGRIPQTMEKIRAGKPVKIVCWGDSVTAGGEAEAAYRYPNVLRRMLSERFPDAKIDLEVVAVPGSNISNWLWPETHAFGHADWQLVADARPDLIVLEFVNDAWIERANLEKLYRDLLVRCKRLNAELILITPHFTHPEMMDFKDIEGIDRRPYTAFLREFAAQNHLAVADASRRWENLAAEGIPYVVLLANSINHPDADGHRIFAEEVIQCFEPENK